MKVVDLGKALGKVIVMDEGETCEEEFPMFEMVSCPAISVKEMTARYARGQGCLVAEKETEA